MTGLKGNDVICSQNYLWCKHTDDYKLTIDIKELPENILFNVNKELYESIKQEQKSVVIKQKEDIKKEQKLIKERADEERKESNKSKRIVKLIDVNTNETTVHDSINDASIYVKDIKNVLGSLRTIRKKLIDKKYNKPYGYKIIYM